MSSTASNLLQGLFFDESYYLTQKVASLHANGENNWTVSSVSKAIANIGMTPWQHFVKYGAFEKDANGDMGIDPSLYFDLSNYYQQIGGANQVKATGLDPISHYAESGYKDARVSVTSVQDNARLTFDNRVELNKSIYFNESEYLANKTKALIADGESQWTTQSVAKAIADAGMTPWQHFVRYGAFEKDANGDTGIDPSQYFDVSRYYEDKVVQTGLSSEQVLSAFKASHLDPVTHYGRYGYLEGVNPRATSLEAVHLSLNAQGSDIPPQSGNALIDSLLIRENSWPNLNAIAAEEGRSTVYYRFLDDHDVTQYDYEYELSPLNQNQKTAYLQALSAVSDITGVKFAQANKLADADLLFMSADLPSSTLGLTNPQSAIFGNNVSPVMLNSPLNCPKNADPRFGQEGFETVAHEIGHAMGLDHPFYDELSADTHPVMPKAIEDTAFSIMSYDRANQTEDSVSGELVGKWCMDGKFYYSPVDIMALQYLYGTDGLNGSEGLVYDDTVLV